MEIDERFGFGKYKGLTLREIYQGSEQVSQTFIKDYVLERITNPITEFIVPGCVTFEVSDTLIRTNCALPDVSIEDDLTEDLEMMFRDADSAIDYLWGLISIDKFNIDLSKSTGSAPEIAGGRPEYIEWCMRKVHSFYIKEITVNDLQSLPIYRLKGVKINRKIENIYEYSPKIEVEYRKFSEGVVVKNREKIPIFDQQNKSESCVEQALLFKQGDQVFLLAELPDSDIIQGDLGTVMEVCDGTNEILVDFANGVDNSRIKILKADQLVHVADAPAWFWESETEEEDESRHYADYSHYSTCACGESPCMCSDPDPG